MFDIKKLENAPIYFLLAWYLISPFFILDDNTIPFGLKICGAVITYLTVFSLLRVILFKYSRPSFVDFTNSFMLTVWYIYFTIRDYGEPGYGIWEKLFYVNIDLLSLLFFVDSFINFILNSNFFIFSENKINLLNKTFKVFIGALFFFVCFKLLANNL